MIKFEIQYQGKRIDKEWSHFAWLATINGETFEYKTGIGHATKWKLPGCPSRILIGKQCIKGDDEWVHVPSQDDILNCLFSDASAGKDSFNDFCDNFGYSTDSIKAFDTYRECMAIETRLRRALGADYESERQRIEKLEL